jgi:hypothetical protein
MHTPGPWVVKEQGNADDYALLVNNEKWVISIRQNGEILPPEQNANAHLIAAAPDMLAAMKEFVARVEAGEVRSKRTYAQFKAIIAKAEAK